MIWKTIEKIENFVNYSVVDWVEGLRLGYLIYFIKDNLLRVVPTDNLKINYERYFQGNNSFYYLAESSLFVSIDNQLKKIDFKLDNEKVICSTKEERIKVLNKEYSLGSTITRKPRVNRNVIVKNEDCSIVYFWDYRSNIIGEFNDNIFLFKDFENDGLSCIDIIKKKTLWSKKFNKRIGSSRFCILAETKIFTQDIHPSGATNLLCLDNDFGIILWELENALSFYNYDESNLKLYGLRGNYFEVINSDTGEREIEKELIENLHIASHLTYYDNYLLYFSGYRDNNIPVFGAVNVKNGELVFTQEVEMSGDRSFKKGLDRPIVVGNRLYVKDSLNTLHVFEMVDNSLN